MVAVLPFVILVGIALWQLALAGHALWMCANAARVAARADAVGQDAEQAARSALPDSLEPGMDVRLEEGEGASVEILVPFVLSRWQTPIPVSASADLEPVS